MISRLYERIYLFKQKEISLFYLKEGYIHGLLLCYNGQSNKD